jgi:tetratricopeptide (TPR) repeat protein
MVAGQAKERPVDLDSDFDLAFDLIEEKEEDVDVGELKGMVEQGDVDAAAALFELAPAGTHERFKEEIKQAPAETKQKAAAMLAEARDFKSAGEVLLEVGEPAQAASMFEDGSDYSRAAEAFQSAGELKSAAEAHARSGRWLEAAALYREVEDHTKEVEALQQIGLTEPDRMVAVLRLGELMVQFGHLEKAAQLYMTEVRTMAAGPEAADVAKPLIAVLTALGRSDEAARLLTWLQQVAPEAASALSPTPTPAVAEPLPSAVGTPVDHLVASAGGAPAFSLDPLGAPVPEAEPEPAVVTGQVIESEPVPAEELGEALPDDEPMAAEPASDDSEDAEEKASPFAKSDRKPSPAAYRTLKNIPIFAKLSIVDMKDLYRISEDREFAGGQPMFEDGEMSEGLLAIVEGEVEIEKDGELLTTLGPGDYLGEIGLLRDAPASADATAKEMVKALLLPRSSFNDYLYTRPDAAAAIYKIFVINLAERVVALSNRE